LRQVARYRNDELASVHVLSFGAGADGQPLLVEAVESVQPPIPRDDKWVLIVSTLFGCPVGCAMCDAGGEWRGRLGADQILAQIDHLVAQRYPHRRLPQGKLKIQFARMGEPAFNPAVLEALRRLPDHLDAPGLLPSLSTIAPRGTDAFFDELLDVRDEHYPSGRFQLQFSIHSTDPAARRRLVPMRCWDLDAIARYGERFHRPGHRKLTLNFAACRGHAIDANVIGDRFDPRRFLIKITPLNPTQNVRSGALESWIDPEIVGSGQDLVASFTAHGFDVILSVGELEENAIGSNCGQFVSRHLTGEHELRSGYESERYVTAP
jgi:23S rRNA (adenine2503-C2)-methyltransferase